MGELPAPDQIAPSRQSERVRAYALGELARQDAHADEIGSMDSLEAARNDRTHTEQTRTFGGPVSRAACAVVLSGDHDQRHSLKRYRPAAS